MATFCRACGEPFPSESWSKVSARNAGSSWSRLSRAVWFQVVANRARVRKPDPASEAMAEQAAHALRLIGRYAQERDESTLLEAGAVVDSGLAQAMEAGIITLETAADLAPHRRWA